MKSQLPTGLARDTLIFAVLTEIGIIAQLSRAILEHATPEGVSGAGFGVLNHLARLPGDWSPARLAGAFQVTRGAMTNTLQRLEAEGLVRVGADPADGRAKHVTLTRKGLKARDATLQTLTPAMVRVAGALPGPMPGELLAALATLRAVMDADRDPTD